MYVHVVFIYNNVGLIIKFPTSMYICKITVFNCTLYDGLSISYANIFNWGKKSISNHRYSWQTLSLQFDSISISKHHNDEIIGLNVFYFNNKMHLARPSPNNTYTHSYSMA